eukprot:c11269_g1_i2.p1 GENE.c11269_g1_i2~~c11269_g1_i2.p1  ORF type:complete len:279 (+),score=75.82 c11269_g1_i2:127-963(+)
MTKSTRGVCPSAISLLIRFCLILWFEHVVVNVILPSMEEELTADPQSLFMVTKCKSWEHGEIPSEKCADTEWDNRARTFITTIPEKISNLDYLVVIGYTCKTAHCSDAPAMFEAEVLAAMWGERAFELSNLKGVVDLRGELACTTLEKLNVGQVLMSVPIDRVWLPEAESSATITCPKDATVMLVTWTIQIKAQLTSTVKIKIQDHSIRQSYASPVNSDGDVTPDPVMAVMCFAAALLALVIASRLDSLAAFLIRVSTHSSNVEPTMPEMSLAPAVDI